MATKRTYIGVDEELVVKGRLTIEGNVTQVETTQEVNRVESNAFVINSDGTAGTTVLAIKSGSDFANLSFSSGANLVSSQTITGNILIPSTGSLSISGGATLSGNAFTGVANEAGALTNDRTVTLTGDVSGSVALGLNANTSSPSMAVTIQPNSVALGTDTTGNYVATVTGGTGLTSTVTSGESATPTINLDNTAVTAATYGANASTVSNFTVDAQGRLTAAANQAISITHDQVTDFNTEVRALISVTDSGGDGSLAYNSGTGVITYTGPSAAEVQAHFSAGTNTTYSAGVFGILDSTIRAKVSATDSGGDGSFAYNSSTGAFTYTGPSASEVRAHFTGGTGIDITGGSVAIDNTVVQTTGTQTVSGDKTFTGTVDLSGATLPGNVNFAGNITATNIDTVTQTDSIVTDNNIFLNKGGADQDAKIQVEHTTANVYLKWDEGTDRWQFSNDGSTDYNMLLLTDFSVSNASGDGSLAYSNGIITYTGPSAAEVRAHLSGGTGITYNSGTGAITTTDADIVHDNLSGFVANEHIDHSTVSITAGTGLTGGGTIAATRTLNVIGGDGITANADDIAVDSTVIRTSGDQSLAGAKTFTGKLIIPTTNVTDAGAIFTDANEAWVYVNGSKKQITPTSSLGSAEEANSSLTYANAGTTGTSTFEVYAGQRTVGADTFHGIKGLEKGTYTSITNSATALTIDANITAIRGGFSATDAGGDGSFAYNSSNGTFTYTGPSASEVRAHLSASGLISYNSGTGAFSTTADNYAGWGVTTDSAGTETITSGETLSILGGTGVDVTHSGNTITIAQDIPVGDITAVTAGDGLSGGGTSGAVTLNVAGGYGITANANDIEVANADIRGLFSAGGDLAYNSSTGAFSFTAGAGDIEGVTAGVGLTGGGTSGTVSVSVGSGYGISTTATTVEVANADIRGLFTGSSGVNYNNSTGAITADSSEIRGLFSAGGDLSYNSGTGEFSFTNDAGDITDVNAGVGLTGGGSSGNVTLNVSGLTVSELSAGTLQTSGESFSNDDTSIMTSAAIEDKILSYGYSTTTGDITAVTAGNGLTGGASSGAATLTVGAGSYITVNANDVAVDATTTNTASKVVARDSSGNVAASHFVGTSTQAQYADLAEVYESDANYEPGTVLVIGGDSEVTISDKAGSYKVIGVVSTDPAYLMNSEGNGIPVALRGRVPCKVTGNVNKGDVLIASDTPGHAMVAVAPTKLSPLQIVGRALENKLDASTGIIEIIV